LNSFKHSNSTGISFIVNIISFFKKIGQEKLSFQKISFREEQSPLVPGQIYFYDGQAACRNSVLGKQVFLKKFSHFYFSPELPAVAPT